MMSYTTLPVTTSVPSERFFTCGRNLIAGDATGLYCVFAARSSENEQPSCGLWPLEVKKRFESRISR